MIKLLLGQLVNIPEFVRKQTSFLPEPIKKFTDIVLDISESMLKKVINCDESECCSDESFYEHSDDSSFSCKSEKAIDDVSSDEPKDYSSNLMPAFKEAIKDPLLSKNQEFKVLAIIWKGMMEDKKQMTARDIADMGEEFGLVIRPTNIRKIAKEKLENKVSVVNIKEGKNLLMTFNLTDEGKKYFEDTYISKFLN